MDNSKWSRDWKNFDWDKVIKNLNDLDESMQNQKKGESNIGISIEEFKEYLDWLWENDPDYFRLFLLEKVLREHK